MLLLGLMMSSRLAPRHFSAFITANLPLFTFSADLCLLKLGEGSRLVSNNFLFPCVALTRPPSPPLPQEQGPTVLACLRPPVTHTAWSTVRSRWSCAATVRTAGSRPRSPARCSMTPAASAPTMRMRSGGRSDAFNLAPLCFKASFVMLKIDFLSSAGFQHVFVFLFDLF